MMEGPHCGRLEATLLLLTVLFSWLLTISAQAPAIVFHVSEELPSGTLVGNVKEASNISQEVGEDDVDNLQFQIFSADGLRITSIFSINSRTGAIFTNAMIDREQMCALEPICQLDFDVTVKADINFVRLLTVNVIVDDINDNAPRFPKREITLTVPESAPVNSTEIPISGALDNDTGLNTPIRYSLQVSSVFRLKEVKQLDGSSALKLLVQRELDRESVATYNFLILASDGTDPEALTGTLTVNVLVTDVNDNVPRFTEETFNLTVMETAPVGTVFGHLTASDGDIGANGNLSYRFSLLTQSEVTQLFTLNATSGELIVAADLQYKSGRSFQCVVEVMDRGVPPQVSQAILRIHVADAGNTPPKLELILAEPVFGDQSAMLTEDVQLGTFVGTLKVEDLDEGDEGRVNCTSQDPHFSLQDLDALRYWIVVSQTLDREVQQEMRITLVCSDSGTPPLTSSTTFNVIVRDINDNAPVFSQQVYRASVTENSVDEQSLVRVAASDIDDSTNNIVTYRLDSHSASFFTIDPQSGWISTQHYFDREMTPFVMLTVYAEDSGTPTLSSSAAVSVRIADVNDNSPYVNRTDYYVSENMPIGHIFNLNVADEDEGENGTVMVSVSEQTLANVTAISLLSNGSVQLVSKLDRERQAMYVVPVILTDRGKHPRSSSATLTIHVIDNNDHVPVFLFPTPDNSSVRVEAQIPVGSPVCQVVASDGDMGNNGHVTYTIVDGNSDQWFGINNQTGEIFLIRALLGVAGRTLHLRVSASDQGQPRLSSLAFLDVYILSTNGSLIGNPDSDQEDRYVVMAGVIAGVTFIVAVVVIAVIVHMQNSDLRRRAERSKTAASDDCSTDNAKNLSVLSSKVVTLSSGSRKSNEVTAVDGRLCGHNLPMDNAGFEPQGLPSTRGHKDPGGVLTEEAWDRFHPSFPLFPDGRNQLPSEDHNSDTSGETTTCDSGRGASDEEIVYPLPGNAAAGHPDSPPRIPPRQPLPTTGQWSRDAPVVSTNWSHVDTPQYFTDDPARYVTDDVMDTDVSSSAAADFRLRSRKGPLKVRFSFDDGDAQSPDFALIHGVQNRGYSDDVAPLDSKHQTFGFDSNSQPYIPTCSERSGGLSNQQGPHPPVLDSFHHNGNRNSFDPLRQNGTGDVSYPRDSRQSGTCDVSYPRDSRQGGTCDVSYPRNLRLNPESLYPRQERFPRKQGTHSGWERQTGKTRNSDSLSSLPQSVDDDVSTTTSGSYSIDFDDVANASLEC